MQTIYYESNQGDSEYTDIHTKITRTASVPFNSVENPSITYIELQKHSNLTQETKKLQPANITPSLCPETEAYDQNVKVEKSK